MMKQEQLVYLKSMIKGAVYINSIFGHKQKFSSIEHWMKGAVSYILSYLLR